MYFNGDRFALRGTRSSSPTGPGRATLRDGTSGLSASVYALEVFAGETAVLPCPPPPSDPPATITFFKDGKPLALTGGHSRTDPSLRCDAIPALMEPFRTRVD